VQRVTGLRAPLGAIGNAVLGRELSEQAHRTFPVGLNRYALRAGEAPYRWSRRWHDEPPIGTEVLLGDGLERGIWQALATLCA
jgi:hypothetical protein